MPKMNADDIAPDLATWIANSIGFEASTLECSDADVPALTDCIRRAIAAFVPKAEGDEQGGPEEIATAKAVVRDAARARKARNEDAREYREFLRWQAAAAARSMPGISEPKVERLRLVRALEILGWSVVQEPELWAEQRDAKVAERLRNIMSTCFDGSRSGDLAFQLEDMEKWIPKFTSEWKANHRRWLELCDRLGFDALDLAQHGRVAEVDAVAGDAFELRRIRAIVEDDARKRHGDREGEPSWGVIADCVLGHASQHRQAREIVGVAENVTLDQGLSKLSQVLWAFEASLVSEWSTYPSRAMGALIHAVVAHAEQWRARLRDADAEHYRALAQVESLSAEVARLTGEVAATRAEAKRQIDDAWRHMDRDLIEADEALRAQVGKSIGPVPLPRQLPLLLWFIVGYLGATTEAQVTDRLQEAAPDGASPAAASGDHRWEFRAEQVRCTGNVTVRINKDRVVVKGQSWTSDDPNFKAWDVSLHDDDPRFGLGSQDPQTMELGARIGTWTWKGSMGGFGDIKWQGAWTAEPKQAASTEVERLDYSRFPPGYSGETTTVDAWSEWKLEHDPPGTSLFCNGPTWSWQLDSTDQTFEGTYPSAEDARAAAWAWYDRRLALDPAYTGRGAWPRCLSWSTKQVAAVEYWLVDSTSEMPEVLRG